MKFTIDRNKWLRGEGFSSSNKGRSCLLRSSDRKMCCLGIFLKSLGASDESLLDMATPADVDPSNSVVPDWLLCDEPQIYLDCPREVYDLMESNDDDQLSEDEREYRVEKFFASKGIEVEFVE